MTGIPHYIINLCFLATVVSLSISLVCIFLHLLNYRKPLQQRLVVRILIIIPIYSIVCYLNLVSPKIVIALVEPIKEIYEAYVLYMFYCLLTDLLGGERNIIIMTSGRAPVTQPFPMSLFGRPVDISDPESFLHIKRCILQYVWLKPFLCLCFAIDEIMKNTNKDHNHSTNFLMSFGFWINIIYNACVSLSLYNLALFWKCLYGDLIKFNPWGKFLCVKLIIFASYWQGIILSILNYFGYLQESSFEIQNSVLCFELIGFAIGHWYSFNFKEYTIKYLSTSARLSFKHALIDVFGYADLIYDFNITFKFGNQRYNFKHFQSVDNANMVSQFDTETRLKKLNQGLRFYNLKNGKKGTYWLNDKNRSLSNSSDESLNSITTNANSVVTATSENSNGYSHGSRSLHSPEISHFPDLSNSSTYDCQSENPKVKTHSKKNKITRKLKHQLIAEQKINAIKKSTKSFLNQDQEETDQFLKDIGMTREEFISENRSYIQTVKNKPFGDDNYPVIYDRIGYIYSNDIKKRRQQAFGIKSSESNALNVPQKTYGALDSEPVNGYYQA